jgi:hypothetical protein
MLILDEEETWVDPNVDLGVLQEYAVRLSTATVRRLLWQRDTAALLQERPLETRAGPSDVARKLVERFKPDPDEDSSSYWTPSEGSRRRKEILSFGDHHALSTREVQSLIGVRTRQAVALRRHTHRLLGLPVGPRTFRYPAWQFDLQQRAQIVSGLADILETAPADDPWGVADILTTRQRELGDRIPITALRESAGSAQVVQQVREIVAATYGDP